MEGLGWTQGRVHPLQVELGRYFSPKTPINERLCKMCNMEVEDQEHFLLHSTSLRIPRAALWAEISEHNPDFISFDSTAKLPYLLHPTEPIFIMQKGFISSTCTGTPVYIIHIDITHFFTLYLCCCCCCCCFCFLAIYTLSCHPCLTIALYNVMLFSTILYPLHPPPPLSLISHAYAHLYTHKPCTHTS